MPTHLLTSQFEAVYHTAPDALFFAPGRVNLIGEHIDYNGGLVFPCAITKGTYAAVSPRNDQNFQLYSANFEETGIITLSPEHLSWLSEDGWTNYVKGVLLTLSKRGLSFPFGLNIVVYGDLPNGAGLSSSASLEMLMCKIFDAYYEFNLSSVDMALIGKQVENEFMGVNSGIMDQFAVALGEPDCALLLNCNTQEYKHVPCEISGYDLVIMNTNKRRELADSKYNERFAECTRVLEQLKAAYPITCLCDLTSTQLPELEALHLDDTLWRRLRHVITENERVVAATKALAHHDLHTFGQLLIDSHRSLQHDYEVTGVELDTLVEAALTQGAIGARMTGAGFGGCAIALVASSEVDSFINQVGIQYKEIIGYDASFYKATVGSGPVRL